MKRGLSSDDVTVAARRDAVRLSRDASEQFAAALIDAPDPNPAMQRVFAHHARLIRRASVRRLVASRRCATMLIEAHLGVARRVCVTGGVVVLLCSGAARASGITVTVTQIGSSAEDIGRGYNAACGAGACRLALPVRVGGVNGVRCVLDVRVTEADARGVGEILFSAGPCETRMRLAVAPDASFARYQLDENGAEAKSLSLPFIPSSEFSGGQPATAMNDGVWRPSTTIRVDIVARAHAP